MKVAFQGEHGAYSELAAVQLFGRTIETIPCKTFSEVFNIVEKGDAHYGLIPIENSLEGSIGQNYDLLLKTDLKVSGETILRIVHCLIANRGAFLDKIKKVYSHPQALGQCREFLEELNITTIPVYDTAGSVKMVKESGDKDAAGIASELAANIYHMKILKKGIETNKNNFTRFFVISKNEALPTGDDKTSLVFMARHEPGSLYQALKAFADKKINLTKLESRPIIGKPWEYRFYLDFIGHLEEHHIKEAIKDLRKNSTFVRVIGSYPKANHPNQK
ncbi:MAG: prephenate dehydratase [Promethearchaeota archaeon]